LNLNTIINTAIYYWVTELGFATASPSVAATFFFFPLPRAHCFSCAAINRRRRFSSLINVAPVFSVPIGSMGGSAVTGGAACCPFITSPTVHVRRRICWSDPLVNQVLLHLRSVIHAVIRWSIRLRFAYFSQAHALQVMAVPHVKKIFTRKSVVAASCF
jgi:hypothetical protein